MIPFFFLGILLEWEDTFPWSGILEQNRASEAYTIEEVDKILGAATRLGLTVVPLVQTFGHLEWILKVEKFRRYRENDIYPQVKKYQIIVFFLCV